MELVFEVGDESAPVGHALAYFTAADGQIYATYVQTFPIAMNLAQYLPQVFASMVTPDQIDSQSATAMPPAAQPVEGGVAWLRAQAEARHDDLINAGSIYSTDPINLMGMTHEVVAAYSEKYRDRPSLVSEPVRPVLNRYADFTEAERLGEMTKLVGRLRDNLGTPEASPIEEELKSMAAGLLPKYRSDDLVRAASTPGQQGQQLAMLYLQRAYKLLSEDYLDVGGIEEEIRAIETGEVQPSDS
jgi:hypothetical protein